MFLYPVGYNLTKNYFFYTRSGITWQYMQDNNISDFIKNHRLRLGFTQEELAEKAGVGLRFIRDLEQGKSSLRMDKVNQVLDLFGYRLRAARGIDPHTILNHYMSLPVLITLKDKSVIAGSIMGSSSSIGEKWTWTFLRKGLSHIYTYSKDDSLLISIPHDDIDNIEPEIQSASYRRNPRSLPRAHKRTGSGS